MWSVADADRQATSTGGLGSPRWRAEEAAEDVSAERLYEAVYLFISQKYITPILIYIYELRAALQKH